MVLNAFTNSLFLSFSLSYPITLQPYKGLELWEIPSVKDLATEVYTVSTTAITTTIGPGHGEAPPTYFNAAAYDSLTAFAAPFLGPLSSTNNAEEPAEYRLPIMTPPWLQKANECVRELDSIEGSETASAMSGSYIDDDDGSDTGADMPSFSLQELEEVEHLRRQLWSSRLLWTWKSDEAAA